MDIKKSIIVVFCLYLPIKSFTQTTLEEYNYVTKGYKIQIESGLDMKKGYEFIDLGSKEVGTRKAELKALHRIKNNGDKEIAAYMVVYKKQGLKTEYICVPHPESTEEIKLMYAFQLYDFKSNTNSSERLQLIAYLLSEYLIWK